VYSEGAVMDGEAITAQESSSKKNFVQLAFQSESQQTVIFQYGKVSKAFSEILTKVEVRDSLDEYDIKVIIDDIFKLLTNYRTDVTQYILYGMQGESGPVENAINSTMLSIMMGQQLHLPPSKVQALATSALLHDLGMIRVGKKYLINKKSFLMRNYSKSKLTQFIRIK
jgi:HD-GYP domain-containing protein (c-di-GMP phosphodiesterase class II)